MRQKFFLRIRLWFKEINPKNSTALKFCIAVDLFRYNVKMFIDMFESGTAIGNCPINQTVHGNCINNVTSNNYTWKTAPAMPPQTKLYLETAGAMPPTTKLYLETAPAMPPATKCFHHIPVTNFSLADAWKEKKNNLIFLNSFAI